MSLSPALGDILYIIYIIYPTFHNNLKKKIQPNFVDSGPKVEKFGNNTNKMSSCPKPLWLTSPKDVGNW